MSQGFIQLHRKILDEWFWKDPKLAHLMVTLILEVNHQPKMVSFQGEKRMIGRGETIRTTRQLDSITGIPKSTISKMLKRLCKENEIEIIKTKASHIRILKYEQYLTDDFDENWDKDGTEMGLNNNDKNDNNYINNQKDIKSFNEVVAEIMDDESFIENIKDKFQLNDQQLEDEVDHMYCSHLENDKPINNPKASFKNWLYNGIKMKINYIQKEIAKSNAYDNPK